jgi:hypothetical protein
VRRLKPVMVVDVCDAGLGEDLLDLLQHLVRALQRGRVGELAR